MAYIDQEKKQKIAAAINALKLPESWRISLRVRHHSTLVISILKAPATVLDDYIVTPFQQENAERSGKEFVPAADNLYINESNIANTFRGPTLKVLQSVMDAVKQAGEWFDKSDTQSDYFHVAFWIDMKFGSLDKECELVGKRRSLAQQARTFTLREAEEVAEHLGVGLVEDDAGNVFPEASCFLNDECAVHEAGRANVVQLRPVAQFEPTLAEKIAIARAEIVRRYKSAFAATPAGASLNDAALTVLAEAALTVTVD